MTTFQEHRASEFMVALEKQDFAAAEEVASVYLEWVHMLDWIHKLRGSEAVQKVADRFFAKENTK